MVGSGFLGFSCCGDDTMAFAFYWGEPSELTVAALSVVPDLEVFKYGVGQLQAGVPDPGIEPRSLSVGPSLSSRRTLVASSGVLASASVAPFCLRWFTYSCEDSNSGVSKT